MNMFFQGDQVIITAHSENDKQRYPEKMKLFDIGNIVKVVHANTTPGSATYYTVQDEVSKDLWFFWEYELALLKTTL